MEKVFRTAKTSSFPELTTGRITHMLPDDVREQRRTFIFL